MEAAFNYNVGVLGHIDSGKTSLVRALSTVLSTASLDKSPQSQERKITLDLGFSSFRVPMPEHLITERSWLQFTLVDCPGHASLIRTVLAGSAIIDKMLLVIDSTKGVQTQTAECIVTGELMVRGSLVVALNKIDLVDPAKLDQMEQKVLGLLRKTKFAENVQVVRVAAAPREGPPANMDLLISCLINSIEELPVRTSAPPLVYLVDHCFPIKGKGTVLTGTVVNGAMKVGDTIEIANLRITKKIKSMQSFHESVNYAVKGDRVALCVTQLASKLLERGIISSPGAVRTARSVLIKVSKITYFKFPVTAKSKYHIIHANEVTMGSCLFFSAPKEESKVSFEVPTDKFNPDLFYLYEHEMGVKADREYFAVISLENEICVLQNSLIIGAKLDLDTNSKHCRLGFYGNIEVVDPEKTASFLKIYKTKGRRGNIERIKDEYFAIGIGMFTKQSDISKFVGLAVDVAGSIGVIDSTFGKSGKFNVRFPNGDSRLGEIILTFRKLLWDKTNSLIQ